MPRLCLADARMDCWRIGTLDELSLPRWCISRSIVLALHRAVSKLWPKASVEVWRSHMIETGDSPGWAPLGAARVRPVPSSHHPLVTACRPLPVRRTVGSSHEHHRSHTCRARLHHHVPRKLPKSSSKVSLERVARRARRST